MQLWRTALFLTLAAGLAACGQSGCRGGGETGAAAARVPARSGQVWEVDASADRSAAPGAVLAFVTGLHVVVVDGDRVFAGMTAIPATRGQDGARVLELGNGLTARMAPAGERLDLRFSTGEAIALREQPPRTTQ